MKILLSFLITMTFFGSSFLLLKVGSVAITLFRMVFLTFCALHILNKNKPTIKFKSGRFYKKLLLVFAFFLAITYGMKYDAGDWLSGTVFLSIDVILIYFIVLYSDNMKDINRYMIAYIIGIFANIIVSIFEYNTGVHVIANNYFSGYHESTWQYAMLSKAPTAFLYNPNNVGVAILMGMPFIGALEKKIKSKFINVLVHLGWFVLCFYVIFATGSRGAILFYPIFVLIYLLFRRGATLKKIVIVAVTLLLAIVFVNANMEYIFKQWAYSGLLRQNSIMDTFRDGIRVELIEGGLKSSVSNFFIGTGPNSAETAVWDEVGMRFPIHNFWIEWLVTQGIGGMVCFLVLYFRSFYKMCKSKSREARIILIALLTFVAISVIPPTMITLNFIWLIFGFSIAIEKIEENSREDLMLRQGLKK